MQVLISLKCRNICWGHEILICCWWAKNQLHLQLGQTKHCRAEETNRPQLSPELHLHCSTMAKRGDSLCWPLMTLSQHRNDNKKRCIRAFLSWRLKQPGQNSPRNTTTQARQSVQCKAGLEWSSPITSYTLEHNFAEDKCLHLHHALPQALRPTRLVTQLFSLFRREKCPKQYVYTHRDTHRHKASGQPDVNNWKY